MLRMNLNCMDYKHFAYGRELQASLYTDEALEGVVHFCMWVLPSYRRKQLLDPICPTSHLFVNSIINPSTGLEITVYIWVSVRKTCLSIWISSAISGLPVRNLMFKACHMCRSQDGLSANVMLHFS